MIEKLILLTACIVLAIFSMVLMFINPADKFMYGLGFVVLLLVIVLMVLDTGDVM